MTIRDKVITVVPTETGGAKGPLVKPQTLGAVLTPVEAGVEVVA